MKIFALLASIKIDRETERHAIKQTVYSPHLKIEMFNAQGRTEKIVRVCE